MKMSTVLHQLIDVGNCMGEVESAHMYDTNFSSVDGKTKDGKKFSITISIKEEENNGN